MEATKATKVVVLAADLFEDIELLYPVYRLREEGVDVTIAGVYDYRCRARRATGRSRWTPPSISSADEFDALVIPGGFAPDKLRRSGAVLDLVHAFDTAAKPIAFICHAGWVPISAGNPQGPQGHQRRCHTR